jgi:DNA-binding CsgD family transcriptional regulator
MRKIFFLGLLLLFFISLNGQIKSVGFSFVHNYTKETYGAGTQIWSISQDLAGIMYFGNNSGLLTFDGAEWRLYPVPNRSIVRAVEVGEDQKIYIGAFNEFGYFSPDARGELVYHSLLDRIPNEYRDFGEVWHIMPYNGGFLFNSFNAVFFLKDENVQLISFDRNLHFSFDVGGKYYIEEIGNGLLKLNEGELELVKGSEFFANISVSGIIPYSDNKVLVVTREHGLYLLENGIVKLYDTPLQEFCRINQVYRATMSGSEYLVLGTVQNGIIILDRAGNLVQHLNRRRGLQNNTVLSLYLDKSNNLWMGLDNGIDYALLNSPLSYFVHENEIGAAYVVELKGNDLFIGTNQGLYHSKWPRGAQLAVGESTLDFISGSQGQVWMLQNRKNILLVGHDKGTFIASRNSFRSISSIPGGWVFIDIPSISDMLLEGTYSGLLTYRYVKRGQQMVWEFSGQISGFDESCKQIQFDKQGFLWVGHGYRGIFRLQISKDLDSVVQVRHYTELSGLPSNFNINLLKFNNRVIVSSEHGIYIHNDTKDIFEKDKQLSELFDNRNVHTLIEDRDGNIWYFSNNATGILKSNFDGTYSKTSVPFMPLQQKVIATYENVFPVDRSNILFCTEEGVIHFDPTFEKNYQEPFNVLVRNVEILPDSFLYRGYNSEFSSQTIPPEIKFRHNAIRLSFSTVSYEFPEHNQYSYMLSGFDYDWGEWSSNTEKEYTNLHEGEYKFLVKARNIYGLEREAIPYTFIILPPWYRSLAAYLSYAFLFLMAIVLTAIYVVRKIEREKHRLKEKQKHVMKERERIYAEESLKAEQEIIKLQNEKLEIEYQRNKTELESRTKELASIAMQITYKNELLTQIRQKLSKVSSKMIHLESKHQVDSLIKTLEKDIMGQDEWDKFEVHFDQVHEDFMKKLRNNYPELTPKDLRLCAYLRMNLSSKEIAPLLNISIRGVEISRYRLRKKLYLSRDANLTDFMMHL